VILQYTVIHRNTHCNTLYHSATEGPGITHHNTLQLTATHYTTLHHTAIGHSQITHCNTTPHHTATHCNRRPWCHALQQLQLTATLYPHHTATHCNTLQQEALELHTCDTAIHCNTPQHALQYTITQCNRRPGNHAPQHTATHRITLHHTATHCYGILSNYALQHNLLQQTTPHCNTLRQEALVSGTATTATYRNTLPTPHCNTLQHTATHCNRRPWNYALAFAPHGVYAGSVPLLRPDLWAHCNRGAPVRCVAVCCSLLQRVAACCSVTRMCTFAAIWCVGTLHI